jgi:putative ABC transport system ATP-binding protein
MNLVKTEKLTFCYPSSGIEYAFPDIQLEKGENLLLTGKSGSGKTTLLHLLAGILIPTGGSVVIDGVTTGALRAHEMDQFRGKKIGLIFQENYFIESLSVMNNLTYTSILCGLKPDKVHIGNLLRELDIAALSGKKPGKLSRGELQRFSIARALVNKPVVLLADEPTSSLDDENCGRFADLMKQVSVSHGLSLIVATHDGRLKPGFTNSINL